MNKSLQLLFVSSVLYAHQAIGITTKETKLEALFTAICNREQLSKAMEPMFSSLLDQFVFANEQAKRDARTKAHDVYFDALKKVTITEYGKHFEEAEIDELLAFYNTPVGKKLNEKRSLIEVVYGSAIRNIVCAIQESIVQSGGKLRTKDNPVQEEHTSTKVVYFEDLIKKSAPTSAKELFEKAVAEGICVVKFSATWCPPCRQYKPVFESVAEQCPELMKVCIKYIAIDIDKVADVTKLYKITSVPTTIFFKSGKEVARLSGALSKDTLVGKLQEIIIAR